jgi:hypothetical protein
MTGCGPEAPAAELDDVCGEASPFRLLELDADERAMPYATVRVLDERLWFVVGEAVDPLEVAETTPIPSLSPEHTRVITTGACGEAPVEVGRDVFSVFEDVRFPGVVLGCAGGSVGGDVVVLDPSGTTAPRVLMPAPACGGVWTDHGIVALVDPGFAPDPPETSLMLVPYPDSADAEPIAPIVLADAIRLRYFSLFQVVGDEVFAVNPADELVRISLPSGDTVVEQAGVATWSVAHDASMIAWVDVASVVDSEGFAVIGQVSTRAGAGPELGAMPAELGGFQLHEDAEYLELMLGDGPPTTTRLHELPELLPLTFPPGQDVRFAWSEREWITIEEPLGRHHLVDPDAGTDVPLADVVGVAYPSSDGALEVLERDPIVPMSDGVLWRVPVDGSAPTKLAERASHLRRWIDEDLVTVVGADAHLIAELVEVEPGSLDELAIDDHVFHPSLSVPAVAPFDDRDVVYSVTDGDRSGVWVARIAE